MGEVKSLIRDSSEVRITRSIRDTAYAIIRFKEEYSNLFGIEPSNETIAKELHIKEFDIRNALETLQESVSIFEPIYNDGGDTIYLQDQIADVKNNNIDRDMLLSMRETFNKIKGREREVLMSRYIIGKTQIEIAEDFGVSQAQVSRIEKSAIKNIKKLME